MHYAQIRNLDLSNGEGIGVALFVQGCRFRCPNCFNTETWDFNGGNEWTSEIRNKFLELANRPYIKRISILGGEPLEDKNIDDVLDLVNRIRLLYPQKNIWLYSGYTWNEIAKGNMEDKFNYGQWTKRAKIVAQCNILVDGQYIDSQRDITLPYRGSKNQRVIDIQKTLQKGKIILWKTKKG